nr:unnamed protein product [Digitaria exilis]
MCLSILPLLMSAGSSFSTWLVVNTMSRSAPHADHSPSMKLSRPDNVTLLLVSGFFVFALLSSEQSMSSITMIDLPLVSMKSFRRSLLECTDVSSMS